MTVRPTMISTPTATTETPVARICEAIHARRRFLITSHARPDGDSIGSQLAMLFALEALGKEVHVVNADPAPEHYMDFPGMDRIEISRTVHSDVEALIVNRIHPSFGDGMAEADRQRASTLGDSDLARLYANRADFRQIADGEERHMESLAKRVAPAPVVRVPFLDSDVHDVKGLGAVARYLAGWRARDGCRRPNVGLRLAQKRHARLGDVPHHAGQRGDRGAHSNAGDRGSAGGKNCWRISRIQR